MNNIIIEKSLKLNHIKDILEGTSLILCVRDYCHQKTIAQLADWIETNEKLDPCPHEHRNDNEIEYVYYGVDTVGASYNITYWKNPDSEEYARYYDVAKTYHSNIRSACFPFLNPFDNFRLELDEVWPKRVGLANFDNHEKMIAGLARLVIAGKDVLVSKQPHCDSVPREKVNLKKQFAANIYLDVPNIGGELEIWDVPPLSLDEIERISPTEDLRSALPPSTTFKPEKGDLIIFNARKPHAIKSFLKGRRITLQGFLGFHEDDSISIWS